MKKEWFVLQTLTGQENKVQTSIKARTALEQMGEYIGQCIIPMEKVTETKNGKKRTLNKKVFPGYVLVEMVMPGDNVAIDVKLIAPVALEEKMRFAIREGGRTVGAGTVSKIIK